MWYLAGLSRAVSGICDLIILVGLVWSFLQILECAVRGEIHTTPPLTVSIMTSKETASTLWSEIARRLATFLLST